MDLGPLHTGPSQLTDYSSQTAGIVGPVFILTLKICGVGGRCIWIITSALVLLLSFDLGDGPGPELDNFATEMKCYVKSII